MDTNDTVSSRRSRAGKAGVITAAVAFCLILGGTVAAIYLGFGAPPDQNMERRIGLLLRGSLIMSFWIGLIAYGVARLVIRSRHGPLGHKE